MNSEQYGNQDIIEQVYAFLKSDAKYNWRSLAAIAENTGQNKVDLLKIITPEIGSRILISFPSDPTTYDPNNGPFFALAETVNIDTKNGSSVQFKDVAQAIFGGQSTPAVLEQPVEQYCQENRNKPQDKKRIQKGICELIQVNNQINQIVLKYGVVFARTDQETFHMLNDTMNNINYVINRIMDENNIQIDSIKDTKEK